LDYSRGEYICRSCGAVQPKVLIDETKEWREFEDDDKSGDRARAEKSDGDFGTLGTGVSASNYGSNSVSAAAKSLTKYAKMTSGDRSTQNLKDAFSRINELAVTLQLPSLITQNAKEILRQFEKTRDKNIKGTKKDAFIVAVLLVACKQEHTGRTLKGISRSTNIDEKDIKRFYKMLLRDETVTSLGNAPRKSTSNQVHELVGVFCNQLKIPFNLEKEAQGVAEKANSFLEGKRPSSIAAASILFILNLMRSTSATQHKQQDLATVAGISANTLRNVYKEINKNIDQLPTHLFQVKEENNGS